MNKYYLIILCVFFLSTSCSRKSSIEASNIQIIIDKNAPSSVRLAADELLHYLEAISKTTKVVIANRPNDQKKTIYVGRSNALQKVFKKKIVFEKDAYFVKGTKDYLILLGNDDTFNPKFDFAKSYEDINRANSNWQTISKTKTRSPIHGLYKAYNKKYDLWEYDSKGTLNAVYDFLRFQGIEWYLPLLEGEILPKKEKILWSIEERKVSPDFKLRWHYRYAQSFAQASDDDLLWYLRLGLNRNSKVLGLGEPGHGIQNVVADPKVRKSHPDYFALFNGKRNNPVDGSAQVCLSSLGLKDLNVKYARAVFDNYYVDAISVMPPDGFGYMCECNLCKGKDTPDRGVEGKFSNYVWNYVNDVAIELYKSHPNKTVTCFAYGYSLLPPDNIESLSPNLSVGICRNRESFHDASRAAFYDTVSKKWKDLSPKPLFTYDYYLFTRPLRAYYNIPVFIPQIIKEDIVKLKANNFIGEFVEVHTNYNNKDNKTIEAINHLNTFITARLYWDAGQDVNVILNKYYRDMYPGAEKEIKLFYSYLQDNWYKLKADFKKYSKTMDLLNKSIAACKDKTDKERLNLIKDYISPLKVSKLLSELNNAEQREIRVIKCNSKIKVDGSLNDFAWKDPFDFRMGNPISISNKMETSRVKFTWCEGIFNIGLKLREPEIKKMQSRTKLTSKIDEEDHVLIELFTLDGDKLRFLIGMSGKIIVLEKPKDYVDLIKADVAINREDWSIEISIPIAEDVLFSSDFGIKGHIPTDDYPWFFNIQRVRYAKGKKDFVDFARYTNGRVVKNPLSKIYFRGY